MEFPWCLKKVSRVLQKSSQCGSLRGVLRAFQWCLKAVSMEFLEGFNEVPGCFMKLSRVCQRKLSKCMEISKVFQRTSEVF